MRQSTQRLTSHSKFPVDEVNMHCLQGLVQSRFGRADEPASI